MCQQLPRCSRVLLPSLAAGLSKEYDLIILAKLDKLSNADKETQAKIGGEGREGRETDTQRRRENTSDSLCHLSVLQGVVVTTQLLAERRPGLSAQKRPATWAGPEFGSPDPNPPPPTTCFLPSCCPEAGDSTARCPRRKGDRERCK